MGRLDSIRKAGSELLEKSIVKHGAEKVAIAGGVAAGAGVSAGVGAYRDDMTAAGAVGTFGLGLAGAAAGFYGAKKAGMKAGFNRQLLTGTGWGVGTGIGHAALSSNQPMNALPSISNSHKRMTPDQRLLFNKASLDQKLRYNEANDMRKSNIRMAESRARKEMWSARQASRKMPSSWNKSMPWQ